MNSEIYRIKHEYLNIYSHGLGFVLSLIGTFMLIFNSFDLSLGFVAFTVYGLSLSVVFFSSTLYHYYCLIASTEREKKARIFDHIAIFFLIAGTYTPFILLKVNSFKAMMAFYLLWVLVGLGTIMKIFFLEKTQNIALMVYILMGFVCLFFMDEMRINLSNLTMNLLAIGGLFYLIGVIFYKNKRIKYNHFIWHLFVLVASSLHFIAVYQLL